MMLRVLPGRTIACSQHQRGYAATPSAAMAIDPRATRRSLDTWAIAREMRRLASTLAASCSASGTRSAFNTRLKAANPRTIFCTLQGGGNVHGGGEQ
eukprot:3430088-Rhodomonas_salina.1